MDRDSIIRKLNSLRDMANHPSTEPALVESAMRKFNKLMEEYNLTLSDLDIKREGITGAHRKASGTNKANQHPIAYCVIRIANLTNTEISRATMSDRFFIGTPADVQYATFLYDLIYNSCEQAAVAYKMSRDYHNRLNEGQKTSEAIYAFKHGFIMACNKALIKMIDEQPVGNALVVLKKDLIEAFMKQNNMGGIKSGKALSTVNSTVNDIRKLGYKEGQKVKLRKEMENEVKGYLE